MGDLAHQRQTLTADRLQFKSTQAKDIMNGWANHATWNVALWIGNDEMIYRHAKENKNLGYRKWAKRFIDEFGEYITGDGIAWLSDDVDTDEMDEMLAEL